MSQNNGGDNLTSFLLGAICGAAAGLLLAPHTGRETRKRVQKWLDEMEERGEEVLEKSRELYEEGREVVQEKTKKIRKAFEDN